LPVWRKSRATYGPTAEGYLLEFRGLGRRASQDPPQRAHGDHKDECEWNNPRSRRGMLWRWRGGWRFPDLLNLRHKAVARTRQGFHIARVFRGVAEGDLPRTTDTNALASFYTIVIDGMAIRARDGASRKALRAIVDLAMAAWDTMAQKKEADAER